MLTDQEIITERINEAGFIILYADDTGNPIFISPFNIDYMCYTRKEDEEGNDTQEIVTLVVQSGRELGDTVKETILEVCRIIKLGKKQIIQQNQEWINELNGTRYTAKDT